MRLALTLLALSLCGFAAENSKTSAIPAQADAETLDLETIARIREEGLNDSHIMEYASGLFDDIGPRLTGSPDFNRAEDWSTDQLRRMGASNVHAESWGDFGMGWRQIGTSLLMTAPAPATFLAQATPWSPPTSGEVTGEVIAVPTLHDEKDFDQWKGKLGGKIILYGDVPKIDPNAATLQEHYDPAKLEHFRSYPLDGDQNESHVLSNDPSFWEKVFKDMAFREQVGKFFADEHAIAVLRPGGADGDLRDDLGMSLGWLVYRPEHRQVIPSASVSDEAFGRMYRLVSHRVPVSVKVNIATQFYGDHEPGSNVIAEIPGTDLGFTTVTLRNAGSTDHVSFDQVGLPGFQFIQDPRDYETRSVHTNLDTYERLSEQDLKQAATVMAIFVYNTAQRDAMLPRKALPHPELQEQRAKPLEGIYPGAVK